MNLRALLALPGFAPKLRSDLDLITGAPGVVVVRDRRSGARHELRELDCLALAAMDGSRDLASIAEETRKSIPTATEEEVARLVRSVSGLGLFANVPTSGDDAAQEAAIAGLPDETRWSPELPPAPPPRRRGWWVAVIALVAAGLVGAAPIQHRVRGSAALRPAETRELRAQCGGVIGEVLALGSTARAGDAMVKLDRATYDATLAEANAALAAARALGAASGTTELREVASIEEANAKANLAALERAAEGLVIRAPFEGRVASARVSSGQAVRAGDPLVVMRSLATVADIVIPEGEIGAVAVGQRVMLASIAGGDRLAATVEQIGAVQHGGVLVQARVDVPVAHDVAFDAAIADIEAGSERVANVVARWMGWHAGR